MKTTHFSRFACLAFVVCGCVGDAPKPSPCPVVIRLHGDKEPQVEAAGLLPEELKALAKREPTPEQWQALFAVYVERGGERAKQPALLGAYRIDKDVLVFEPRFPLAPGVTYRAVFQPARLPGHDGSTEAAVEKTLLLPKVKAAAPAAITHVYPSAEALPENQLKFYVHFSAPMSRGEAYERIHLLRSDNKEETQPFLELPQELWDRDGKRFTLLLDPGRIKQGLKPREEFGPVLEAGKTYVLVIDRAWKDGEGNPLKESYRKTFRVLPADETQPDPKTWKLTPPTAGTKAPVVLLSPKSLDHALLQRMVWIIDGKGDKVAGEGEVTRQETCWSFTPTKAWKAGNYEVVADTRLEDLAGNSIARPFEVDESRPVQRAKQTKTVKVPFVVR